MQFVTGLPKGVYVAQTRVAYDQAVETQNSALAGFNLALHVGDNTLRVQQHRMQLLDDLAEFGVRKMTWMNQTHSTICQRVEDEDLYFQAREGDALVTQLSSHALMMMTADCLPIVLGNIDGTEVANLHAGWKGLASGIIQNTITAMHTTPTWAWLGAAISQPCFEVGAEVKAAFCQQYPAVDAAFVEGRQTGKFYADLYMIARYILAEHGVMTVLGGDQCSYTQVDDYFSYRRAAQTGRMATFVFIRESC